MKYSRLETTIGILSSILLTGLGVALFIHANLGSDTITVMVDGIHHTLNVSIGSASRIYNSIMLILALLVSYKNIGWATIVYALTVGFAMDFFEQLLAPLNITQAGMIVRLGTVVIAQICFGLTYALLIKYRKGMNQVDAIAYALVNWTRIDFKWIRTGMDVLLLVGGYLLGGVVGIGSIIAMTTTGILIDLFLKLLNGDHDETSTKRI